MTLKARSNVSAQMPLSAVWVLDVRAYDSDCLYAADTVVVTVTNPASVVTTPTVTNPALGQYRAEVTVNVSGRWVARAVGALGAVDFTALVTPITTGAQMPTITDVDDYMGTHSFSDDDLQEALDAETFNQARVCRVPADYTPDLRSALLRRCQFHLAMKRVQLGVVPGDADRDPLRPGRDPEIRRFEAAYRRLPVG